MEALAALALDQMYQTVMVLDKIKFTKRSGWKIMIMEITEKYLKREGQRKNHTTGAIGLCVTGGGIRNKSWPPYYLARIDPDWKCAERP